MKIFLVNINTNSWDQYDGFVMSANNEDEAISFLKQKYGEDGFGSVNWSKGYKIKKLKVSDYDKVQEILSSFNAG